MKRSKLINNVLAFGFFLSMVSIAAVNTADADQAVNVDGPGISNPLSDISSRLWLIILGSPDHNPKRIVVQLQPTDGHSLDGITAGYDGETENLSGWNGRITLPYAPILKFVSLDGAEGRRLTATWWLEY